MSVLSNSKYNHLRQAVSLLKNQLQQQNHESTAKFQLLDIKIKMISQQTLNTKKTLTQYDKQTASKTQLIAQQTKNALKQLISNHPSHAELEELENQMKQLQNSRDKLIRSVGNMNSQTLQKLQTQIDQLQSKITQTTKNHQKHLKQIQSQLKKQIALTSSKLQQNNELLNQQQTLQQLQLLSHKIDKQIGQIKDRRVSRKQNFLNLLQTIILKCKQNSQQQ